MAVRSIGVRELGALREQGKTIDLIDVRSGVEFNHVHAEGARPLPLGKVTVEEVAALRQNADGEPVYVICHSGGRSRSACEKLMAGGMSNVVNVEGGTAAWQQAGLPVVRSGKTAQQMVRLATMALILVALVLGWTVHPYFMFGALAGWVGMLAFGGGCCGSTCGIGR
jgi:rhodanese-related sulfurtransferase